MNHPEGEKEPNQPSFKKPVFWIVVGAGILLDFAGATFPG